VFSVEDTTHQKREQMLFPVDSPPPRLFRKRLQRHGSAATECGLETTLDHLAPTSLLLQTLYHPGLNLAHPFPTHAEHGAQFFERLLCPVQPRSTRDDHAVQRFQVGELRPPRLEEGRMLDGSVPLSFVLLNRVERIVERFPTQIRLIA